MSMIRMNQQGRIVDRNVHFLNTGGWQRQERQGNGGGVDYDAPDYSEIRGLRPAVLTAPLIRLTPTSYNPATALNDHRVQCSIEIGDC
jgi:hypothetical protein